jgi:K+-transporting ATPase A subunit
MGQRWIATIRTQSNILQNIEIDTPGIVRQDAIAQIKSTYGAKEVVTCNPISSSSSSSSGSYSSGSSDSSWFWVLLFGAMIAVYVFRYIIIVAVVLIALYYLYKWFKK